MLSPTIFIALGLSLNKKIVWYGITKPERSWKIGFSSDETKITLISAGWAGVTSVKFKGIADDQVVKALEMVFLKWDI